MYVLSFVRFHIAFRHSHHSSSSPPSSSSSSSRNFLRRRPRVIIVVAVSFRSFVRSLARSFVRLLVCSFVRSFFVFFVACCSRKEKNAPASPTFTHDLSRTHARTHARTRARTHARTHARARAATPLVSLPSRMFNGCPWCVSVVHQRRSDFSFTSAGGSSSCRPPPRRRDVHTLVHSSIHRFIHWSIAPFTQGVGSTHPAVKP